MTKNEIIFFSAPVILLVLVFIFFHQYGVLDFGKKIDTAQMIEIKITFVLVLVTVFYAKRTAEIANATKKQAEEIQKQRYAECLPLLVPDIIRRSIVNQKLEINEVAYSILKTGVGMEVRWCNLGKGVATNVRFSFWAVPLDDPPGKVLFFPPQAVEVLGIGGEKKIEIFETWVGIWYDIPEAYRPRLVAEYQDIYERHITSVQEFEIDQQNRRAFLGDLYFTVNDVRLGKSQ